MLRLGNASQGQEAADVAGPHLPRMTQSVTTNKTSDPAHVGLDHPSRLLLGLQRPTNLIEQAWRLGSA